METAELRKVMRFICFYTFTVDSIKEESAMVPDNQDYEWSVDNFTEKSDEGLLQDINQDSPEVLNRTTKSHDGHNLPRFESDALRKEV